MSAQHTPGPHNGAHCVNVAGRRYWVHFVDGEPTQVDVAITPRGRLASRPYDRMVWRAVGPRSQSNAVREAVAEARRAASVAAELTNFAFHNQIDIEARAAIAKATGATS